MGSCFLTHFMSLGSFWIAPWKYQKNRNLVMFSAVIEKDQLYEIGWPTLREKCPCSEFFWSVFSRIRTKYVFTPNAEKYGQANLRIRTFFTVVQVAIFTKFSNLTNQIQLNLITTCVFLVTYLVGPILTMDHFCVDNFTYTTLSRTSSKRLMYIQFTSCVYGVVSAWGSILVL